MTISTTKLDTGLGGHRSPDRGNDDGKRKVRRHADEHVDRGRSAAGDVQGGAGVGIHGVAGRVRLAADSTALIIGMTSVPTPNDAYIELSTVTQFDTAVITRPYDFSAGFPWYPLNLVADLNAFLGFFCVHMYGYDVSLPVDPSTSPAHQGTHGDTATKPSAAKSPEIPAPRWSFGPVTA